MACGSCGGGVANKSGPSAPYTRGSGGRTLYKVYAATGNLAYQTHDVELARKVQGNYPESRIEPDPDGGTVAAVASMEPEAPVEPETAEVTDTETKTSRRKS